MLPLLGILSECVKEQRRLEALGRGEHAAVVSIDVAAPAECKEVAPWLEAGDAEAELDEGREDGGFREKPVDRGGSRAAVASRGL